MRWIAIVLFVFTSTANATLVKFQEEQFPANLVYLEPSPDRPTRVPTIADYDFEVEIDTGKFTLNELVLYSIASPITNPAPILSFQPASAKFERRDGGSTSYSYSGTLNVLEASGLDDRLDIRVSVYESAPKTFVTSLAINQPSRFSDGRFYQIAADVLRPTTQFWSVGVLLPATVPETGTLVLCVLGILSLGVMRQR